jgi:hypothetical protein
MIFCIKADCVPSVDVEGLPGGVLLLSAIVDAPEYGNAR